MVESQQETQISFVGNIKIGRQTGLNKGQSVACGASCFALFKALGKQWSKCP